MESVSFAWEELKKNSDGMVPVIVQDYETKDVLMMAYMNRESLKISMEEGRTCFYSRSRQTLWRKGETSGNTQEIVTIRADCDLDANEVYCWDCTDWLLYGFKYAMNGDSVVIDFESKQRMKYVIAPFDEGEQASPFAETFQRMAEKLQSSAELNEKYQAASDTITAMETELGELRQFKADTESKALQSAREEVFAQFEDLIGVEAFEDLRAHCENYSDMDALEEKCFAIRGRNGTTAKFSMGEKTPKLKVVRDEDNYTKEPYGGLFARFGIEAE